MLYHYVLDLDTDDMQYYEKAEKILLKYLDIEKEDYNALFMLGELYIARWLLDKSNEKYRLKALEYIDEIPIILKTKLYTYLV